MSLLASTYMRQRLESPSVLWHTRSRECLLYLCCMCTEGMRSSAGALAAKSTYGMPQLSASTKCCGMQVREEDISYQTACTHMQQSPTEYLHSPHITM